MLRTHEQRRRKRVPVALAAMKMLGIRGPKAIAPVRRRRPGALGNAVITAYLEALPPPSGTAV